MAMVKRPTDPGKHGMWRAYSLYVLLVLFAVNCLNTADRAIVGILAEPIRREFGLSDTTVGLLFGFAFVLLYSVASVAISRWIDRGTRRNILFVGICLWSVMTALCGLVHSLPLLLLARVGVGIGEATCYPAALSLIPDYFPPRQRPLAIAVFQSALFGGMIAGTIAAGRIAGASGWRAAFVVFGLAGLVLAAVLRTTVREPVRGGEDGVAFPSAAPAVSMRVALAALGDNPVFRRTAVALALISMTSAVMSTWGVVFMMRVHDLPLEVVGRKLGPIIGGAGLLGTLAGGAIGTVLARRDGADRAVLLVPLLALPLCVPAQVTFLVTPDADAALVWAAVVALLTASYAGPCFAIALDTVKAHERGLAAAVLLMAQMLVGFGLAPLLTGLISDAMAASRGADSLRFGLAVAPVSMAIGWVWLLRLYLAAGNPVGRVIATPA